MKRRGRKETRMLSTQANLSSRPDGTFKLPDRTSRWYGSTEASQPPDPPKLAIYLAHLLIR
eukprot:scaffold223313_cov34-Prasinocladus_malaysianus.AAC.1